LLARVDITVIVKGVHTVCSPCVPSWNMFGHVQVTISDHVQVTISEHVMHEQHPNICYKFMFCRLRRSQVSVRFPTRRSCTS
jgi:hypothetical protein